MAVGGQAFRFESSRLLQLSDYGRGQGAAALELRPFPAHTRQNVDHWSVPSFTSRVCHLHAVRGWSEPRDVTQENAQSIRYRQSRYRLYRYLLPPTCRHRLMRRYHCTFNAFETAILPLALPTANIGVCFCRS